MESKKEKVSILVEKIKKIFDEEHIWEDSDFFQLYKKLLKLDEKSALRITKQALRNGDDTFTLDFIEKYMKRWSKVFRSEFQNILKITLFNKRFYKVRKTAIDFLPELLEFDKNSFYKLLQQCIDSDDFILHPAALILYAKYGIFTKFQESALRMELTLTENNSLTSSEKILLHSVKEMATMLDSMTQLLAQLQVVDEKVSNSSGGSSMPDHIYWHLHKQAKMAE